MNFTNLHEDESASDGSNNSIDEIGLVSAEGFKQPARSAATASCPIGLSKVSQFICAHRICLESFWKGTRNHASIDDIRQFCEGVGICLSAEDEVDLMEKLFGQRAIVSVRDVVQLVESWRQNSEQLLIDFTKNRTEKLADSLKKKIRLNSARHSDVKHEPTKPFAQQSTMAETTEQKLRRPLSSTHLNINKSKEYLRLQKRKEQKMEKLLEGAINKAKDEYEYELLLKMSEANDLNKEMQSVTTYRAYKNAQGNLKVRVFNLDRFDRELKLEEFQREFNNLKKKYNETKKISVWHVLSSGKRCGSPPERSDVVQRNIKKPELQKELVSILTETMNLTNLLKSQLRILRANGVCPKS